MEFCSTGYSEDLSGFNHELIQAVAIHMPETFIEKFLLRRTYNI